MIIAIPTNGHQGLKEQVAEHFGRCYTYTLIDENGKLLKIIDNTSEHMGGYGLPPELLKAQNVDVLLCKGLGSRALDWFERYGIKVYICNSDTVKEIYQEWKHGKPKKADSKDACRGAHN